MNEADPIEEAIFNAARQFPNPAKLTAYLDLACEGKPEMRRRIERLLATSREADSYFQRNASRPAEVLVAAPRPSAEFESDKGPTVPGTSLSEGPGTCIGHYKLLQQIGEGGFGAVFMAEQQQPVRRMVALKIIKLGMDTKQVIARFEAERQALAMMDHPNIAKVFDAGSTGSPQSQISNPQSEITPGRPYFVMELVKGVPITQFCDKTKLSTTDRLKLFIGVCHAIQHAHQKGIIHRDIKPSNILVTLEHSEPMVKVIDFGIAKAINQRLTEKTLFTNFAQMIGTPAYMSPEQAEMSTLDIDTRTDIYSLGVLLYELLTGTTPIEKDRLQKAAYGELQRLIREEEPERPSTRLSTMNEGELSIVAQNRASEPLALGKLFRSDLDWIVMRALEKDRRRRYDTANDLLADVHRHLSNEPVLAKPPSTLYKAQKFIRRNQTAVGTAATIVLILVLVLVLLSVSYQREREARFKANLAAASEAKQRERAENETRRAQAEAKRATSQALETRRSEYAGDMLLAQKFIVENNRGAAIKLLSHHLPQSASTNANGGRLEDLRGWEWHYLATATRDQSSEVLRDNRSPVWDVAFSPDGRWVASGAIDGSVTVWGSRTHALAAQMNLRETANFAEVRAVAFSPDGKYLAASDDLPKKIHVWEVPTWKKAFELTNDYRANRLAFSLDGRFLAAAGGTRVQGVQVWDMTQRLGVASWPIAGVAASIHPALAFSADSALLAYDLGDGRLGRWDTARQEPLTPIPLHERNVQEVAFSEDGRWAASQAVWSIKGTIVWSLPEWKELYHCSNEEFVALSSRHDRLLTAARQELHTWRLSTGELLATQAGHLESISSGAISPTEPLIATASYDKTVRLWPLTPAETPNLLVRLTNEPLIGWRQTMMLSSDTGNAVTVSTNGILSLWDTTTMRQVGTRPSPVSEVHSATAAPDGRRVAIGGARGELVLMDMVTGATLGQTNFGGDLVTFLRFSHDGSRLAVHYKPDPEFSYALQILDGKTLQPLRTLESTGGSIHDAAFTPDNRYFVFGSYSYLAQLVDLESGHVVNTFLEHQGPVVGVAITPDARLVATYATDGIIRLWDAQTGRVLDRFRGTWEDYNAIALSPDGSRLAAGAEGVDVWDLITGRQVLTLRTTNEWVMALAWTPDMKRLVGAGNQAIRVWPSDTANLAATNVLLARLRAEEPTTRTNIMSLLSADWRKVMPILDEMILRWDPDGFWRKARATGRLWNGDLAGAGLDNPAYAIPLRDPRCTARQIDLSQFFTRLLVPDGMGTVGVDLGELRQGFLLMDGTEFDVRGLITIAGTSPIASWVPREVRGIPIGQSCERLHFIQATGYEAKDGTPVGRYMLRYADNQTRELPIVYGEDTRNWWTVKDEPTNTPNARIVWRGNCPFASGEGRSVRLWKRTYDNPRPELAIVSLDFVSAMNFPAPFLVALTLE